MHKFWESRTDGEYFKLCKLLTEFPDKFREYYRMSIKTFDYVLESVKDVLQGYSDFRKCNEAEGTPSVRTRYCGKDKNKLHLKNFKCYNNSL